MAALYSAIHLPDGCILIPLVQTGMAHLLPALRLTAQALLWSVWGTVGLTMATPLAAAAMVITRMVYLEDELGEREHRNG